MSSIWNNRFSRIAPFWCKKDTVLQPDLPKEKNPTLARHLISRFLVPFLSLVPNITSKSYAKCCISPIAGHLPPALFVWVEGGWPLHKFSQSLEASTEQVRRAKAGPSEEREIGMMETRTEREWRVMGREREKTSLLLLFPSVLLPPFLNNLLKYPPKSDRERLRTRQWRGLLYKDYRHDHEV